MSEFRLQYGRLQIWWSDTPTYIETMPIPQNTQEFWRQATDNIEQGVRQRNLERPEGQQVAVRDFHKWSS